MLPRLQSNGQEPGHPVIPHHEGAATYGARDYPTSKTISPCIGSVVTSTSAAVT